MIRELVADLLIRLARRLDPDAIVRQWPEVRTVGNGLLILYTDLTTPAAMQRLTDIYQLASAQL